MILLAHNSIGFGGILLILAPYVVKTACVFFAVKYGVIYGIKHLKKRGEI
ncbi:MAG: hypothetical protein HFI39_12730 [Lachnospiraceae bacterium]|nr:hypothetical protein [Lachnospiraceae bacterium]